VDRHRPVELGAVAGRLARVVADAAVNGGERVAAHELAPRRLVLVGLHQAQPLLDVLPGGAGSVAGREQVHVDGHPGTDRSGASHGVGEVGQFRHVAAVRVHGRPSSEHGVAAHNLRARHPPGGGSKGRGVEPCDRVVVPDRRHLAASATTASRLDGGAHARGAEPVADSCGLLFDPGSLPTTTTEERHDPAHRQPWNPEPRAAADCLRRTRSRLWPPTCRDCSIIWGSARLPCWGTPTAERSPSSWRSMNPSGAPGWCWHARTRSTWPLPASGSKAMSDRS
jgi:hypothetical protein